MTKLQELARKLKNADAIADLAEQTAAENPDKPELETEWEKCFDYTCEIRDQIAAEIVKVSRNMIDRETAWKMTFLPKLYALIEKMA